MTVELDESGAPTAILQSGGRADGRTGGKIEAILESWRIEDEWWRQPISRVYVEIIIEGGRRVVLFSDLITGEWFMQQP